MKSNFEVILYYKYTHVANPAAFVLWHKEVCKRLNLKGRILIAHEGINGTLEGEKEKVDEYCTRLTSEDTRNTYGDFQNVVFKRSTSAGTSFPKLVVKVRNEIVSAHLGVDDVNPATMTATHLPAEQLKEWYESGEEFHIVDMRNSYEFKAGHFKGSIDPGMRNFRDLPKVLSKIEHLKDKKVVTVCTGGVRCEKASGYLLKKGFKDVYQLDGGMVTYMQKFPGKDFLGALYVFDDRIVTDTTTERDVVGTCVICKGSSERYINCVNDECHLHFICCESCDVAYEGNVPCPQGCRNQSKVAENISTG